VLLADVADVRSGRLEDPQPQEAEHGHQSEVVPVRAASGSSPRSLHDTAPAPGCQQGGQALTRRGLSGKSIELDRCLTYAGRSWPTWR
jgi:hypothetical protein